MMTIVEAIKEVLREADTALTSAEIYRAIDARHLYTFRSAQPLSIVRAQLRRYSFDAPEKIRAARPVFKRTAEDIASSGDCWSCLIR